MLVMFEPLTGRIIGGNGEGRKGRGSRSLRGLVQLGEFGSQVFDARLSTVEGETAFQVVAAHAFFIADHVQKSHGDSRQQDGQQ